LHFTVLGVPKVLQRHRFTKKGFTYDPSVMDKKQFAMQAAIRKPGKPIKVPLGLTMTFYFNRPKSHYRTGKNSNLLKTGMDSRWMKGKKDLDNLIKLVCDSLEGIFFTNDSLVCSIQAEKLYCLENEQPRTVVGIEIL